MKTIRRTFGLLCILFAALTLIFQPAGAQSGSPLAVVLTAQGPIMPPMYEYIKRGIQIAERENAQLLVIELNTPGGNVGTMLEIIELMGNSRVPIVVFVAPRDAQAASAGALITMAGDIAAMAPRTTIGAASPVGGGGADIESTMERKIKEDMKAKARSLLQRRGEEAVLLGEAMIEEAAAVTANEALEIGFIDFIADDTEDLLQLLNGFSVDVRGETRVLNTENIRVRPLAMSFIESLLLMLTNPNIAFLLLAIGVQAILIELSSPGGWFAGFLGAVLLTLAIYGLGVLPINWFGLIFMAIAFILFVLEFKTPTYGALTAAGAASFIIGALVLFNSPGTPEFQRVSVPLVVGTGAALGLASFAVIMVAIRAFRAPVRIGQESMVGQTGTVVLFQRGAGQVQVGSELWSAEKSADSKPIRKGDAVEVVAVRGLRLIVRKK